MSYLLGLIGLLFGGIVYVNSKRKSAEALLQNQDVRTQLSKATEQEAKNDGMLQAEEQKRNEVKQEAESKTKEVVTNEDILNFFNSNKPN